MRNLTVGLAFIASALFFGCGVDDTGGWSPGPGAPGSVTEVGSTAVLPGEQPPEPSGPSIPAPVADRVDTVSCPIYPAKEIQIESGAPVPGFQAGRDTVCLGEAYGQASPALCWAMREYEMHAASVAACYAEAWEQLDAQGTRILGREWTKVALPMMPEVWAKTPEQVADLAHALSSGMTHLLTGGTSNVAPGAPLCFPMVSGWTLEQSLAAGVKDIKTLVTNTQTQVKSVELGLKKGIDLQVTKDLRLNVAVKFVPKGSNLEPVGTCEFHSPI